MELQRLVRRGQWIPIGGWCVQGDTNLPCGESLIRQALVGQRIFDRLTCVRSQTAYLVDKGTSIGIFMPPLAVAH